MYERARDRSKTNFQPMHGCCMEQILRSYGHNKNKPKVFGQCILFLLCFFFNPISMILENKDIQDNDHFPKYWFISMMLFYNYQVEVIVQQSLTIVTTISVYIEVGFVYLMTNYLMNTIIS